MTGTGKNFSPLLLLNFGDTRFFTMYEIGVLTSFIYFLKKKMILAGWSPLQPSDTWDVSFRTIEE